MPYVAVADKQYLCFLFHILLNVVKSTKLRDLWRVLLFDLLC